MKRETINALIAESLAIEAESAKDAGTLGYMARAMVQATMPHSKTAETHHERVNGNYALTMVAMSPEIGLPFGSIPRLMLAYVGSEALRTGQREVVLGDSMSAFMRELGLVPTGGRWGSVTRIKEQSKRLVSCAISCTYTTPERFENTEPFSIGKGNFWWSTDAPEQAGIFKSTITLSEAFYREITEHPVPVDMRVLKALKQSPLALDVYAWSTYRVFTLNRTKSPFVVVPWESLQLQFGAGYPTDTARGRADFKRKFLQALAKVSLFYPEAKIQALDNGLKLHKSPIHIANR